MITKLLDWFNNWMIRRRAAKYKIDWSKGANAALSGQMFNQIFVTKFSGPCDYIFGIDSVVAENAWIWDQLKEMHTIAVPGSTTESAEGALSAILLYKPKKFGMHGGGNDLATAYAQPAANMPDVVSKTIANIRYIAEWCAINNIAFAWFEILPLGAQHAGLDYWCKQLNQRVRDAGFCKVLDTRKYLAGPDGFIKPEYLGPDGIHPNAAGVQGWFPIVVGWFYG